jgi:hypothetical protein
MSLAYLPGALSATGLLGHEAKPSRVRPLPTGRRSGGAELFRQDVSPALRARSNAAAAARGRFAQGVSPRGGVGID